MADADTVKHLEFVHAVITRHASNSFLIKGWTVAVCAALFGFAVDKERPALALIGVGVAAVFYLLDAYYLRQERLFRCLWAALIPGGSAAGSEPAPYSMSTDAYKGNAHPRWRAVLLSGPLCAVYGALAVAGVAVAVAAAQSDSDCRIPSATSSSAAPAPTPSAGQNVPTTSSCQRGST